MVVVLSKIPKHLQGFKHFKCYRPFSFNTLYLENKCKNGPKYMTLTLLSPGIHSDWNIENKKDH